MRAVTPLISPAPSSRFLVGWSVSLPLFIVFSWLFISGCLLSGCSRYLCSDACAENGECSMRTVHTGDGWYRCYAGSNADCAASDGCRKDGRCFVAEDGKCVQQAEVPGRRCAAWRHCAVAGLCSPRQGYCEATSDAACQRSRSCTANGRCTVQGGVCVPTDDRDCAQSTACELEGLCTLSAGYLGLDPRCVVAPDDPKACKASLTCKRYGRCEPRVPAGCPRCVIRYCGRPGEDPKPPCSEHWANIPECQPFGRCMRDHKDACIGVPAPATIASAAPRPTPAVKPAAPRQTPRSEPVVVQNPQSAPTPGPSAVHYSFPGFFKSGDDLRGMLTHAALLANAKGFGRPGLAMDFLVFKPDLPDRCNPQTSAYNPVNAIWITQDLPVTGTHRVQGGRNPGQFMVKMWAYNAREAARVRKVKAWDLWFQADLTISGTLKVGRRTKSRLMGTIDVIAEGLLPVRASGGKVQARRVRGRIRGTFDAKVIDCSGWNGNPADLSREPSRVVR